MKTREEILSEIKPHWERNVCILRNAIHPNTMFEYGYCPTIDDLMYVATQEEDCECRLVEHDENDYNVTTGPFDLDTLQTKLSQESSKPSMLLINDIERYINSVGDFIDELLSFLPRYLRDDGQISFSTSNASIGYHIDNYNAFLLQMVGSKEWTIGTTKLSLKQEEEYTIPDIPLKVLQSNCCDNQTFILNPGDVLYLPPRIPHGGIALDTCMTFSIGCKSPSANDIFLHFIDELQSTNLSKYAYMHEPYSYQLHDDKDCTGLLSTKVMQDIKEKMIQSFQEFINDKDFSNFLASYFTKSKRLRMEYPQPFQSYQDDTNDIQWNTPNQVVKNVMELNVGALYQTEGIVFSYTTNPETLFIDGYRISQGDFVSVIANHRRITPDLFEGVDGKLTGLLEELVGVGYLYAAEDYEE